MYSVLFVLCNSWKQINTSRKVCYSLTGQILICLVMTIWHWCNKLSPTHCCPHFTWWKQFAYQHVPISSNQYLMHFWCTNHIVCPFDSRFLCSDLQYIFRWNSVKIISSVLLIPDLVGLCLPTQPCGQTMRASRTLLSALECCQTTCQTQCRKHWINSKTIQ